MQIFKNIIKKILRLLGSKLVKIKRRTPSSFIKQKRNLEELKCMVNSYGIFHFRGHRGKEAEIYNWLNKKVLWIEANLVIFRELKDHIDLYFKQEALNLLLGDENKILDFFISNKDA